MAHLDLAKKLVVLPEGEWRGLGLPEQVLEALKSLKDMPQFVAKKRQLKLVAKMLRDVDVTLAERAAENAIKSRADVNVSFHKTEQWRDRLIAEGNSAVAEFLGKYPNVDVQHLTQLIRNAKHESSKGKPLRSSKLLFKLLRELVE